MAKKPTCPYCGKEVEPNDPFKKYKNRKYHATCYRLLVRELNEDSKEEVEPRQKLYDFICELFKIKELTPMMTAQIDKYGVQGLKYDGMLLTLRYFYITKGNDTNNSKGIGIIPYAYEEAKEFFIAVKKAEANNENVKLEGETRHVRIKSKDYSIKDKTIDIEEL